MGAGLIWQLRGDIKMLTRVAFPDKYLFSSHSTISITFPSAGETAIPSPLGIARSGFLKKKNKKRITAKPKTNPENPKTNHTKTLNKKVIKITGYPSTATRRCAGLLR